MSVSWRQCGDTAVTRTSRTFQEILSDSDADDLFFEAIMKNASSLPPRNIRTISQLKTTLPQ